MTVLQHIKRIRCWWRGYHCGMPNTATFRYDVGGWCVYCGNVDDGVNHNDDPDWYERREKQMSKIRITVSGETGSGKSAIAGEIEIALKAIGVPVEWKDADREWWQRGNEYWIDLYKPEVTIIEENIPRARP